MRARFVVIALGALLVAACAPGTPDIGYSPSGTVLYGATGGGAGAKRSLVPTADGGVIATASGARPLTRITAEGVVDDAWGATLPNDCRNTSGAIATGTSVLFTCSQLPTSGPQVWQLWRVTAAGALDPSFGGGDGIVDVPSSINELEVAALPNGGYLVVGYADVPLSRTAVMPLIEMAFSASGGLTNTTQIDIAVIPIPIHLSSEGWRISARLVSTPNGVAAFERLSAAIGLNGLEDVRTRVQHFDVNGAIVDAAEFTGAPISGPNGGLAARYTISGFVSLGDGRVAAAATIPFADFSGTASTVSFLQVIGTNGSLDPQFGAGGVLPLVLADGGRLDPQALVATNRGRFIVVAGAPAAGGAPLVARYDAHTGELDPKYGAGGRAGVALAHVDAAEPRAGFDQVYLGGTDSAGRPTVARIWDHIVP